MTGHHDDFDARLADMFGAHTPAADPLFTGRVMDVLPRPSLARPVALTLAGLTGALVAGWQFPNLVSALDAMMGGFGGLAMEAVGPQALAMGLTAIGLAAVTLVLTRRGAFNI